MQNGGLSSTTARQSLILPNITHEGTPFRRKYTRTQRLRTVGKMAVFHFQIYMIFLMEASSLYVRGYNFASEYIFLFLFKYKFEV